MIPLHASEASSRLSNRIQIFIQRRSNVLGKGLSFREFGAMDSLDSLWQDRVERYVSAVIDQSKTALSLPKQRREVTMETDCSHGTAWLIYARSSISAAYQSSKDFLIYISRSDVLRICPQCSPWSYRDKYWQKGNTFATGLLFVVIRPCDVVAQAANHARYLRT